MHGPLNVKLVVMRRWCWSEVNDSAPRLRSSGRKQRRVSPYLSLTVSKKKFATSHRILFCWSLTSRDSNHASKKALLRTQTTCPDCIRWFGRSRSCMGESRSSSSRSFAIDVGVNHASMRKVLLRRSQTEEAVSMGDVLQPLKFAWW
jgi:hypothetical protein